MVQKILGKSDISKKRRKKHVWLLGRLHIEGRLNEGPRLQRKHKDEKRSKAKQNKANVTPEKDVMTSEQRILKNGNKLFGWERNEKKSVGNFEKWYPSKAPSMTFEDPGKMNA